MEIINRNDLTITNEELEQIYQLYLSNLIDEESERIHSISNYKEKWINEIKSNQQLLCSLFYDNNVLVGYIITYLKNDENFIREFEISKAYQDDGKTFKEMIKMAIPYTNIDKPYTGIIFNRNESAKKSFRRLGAFASDGKYTCTYDRLMKMIDLDLETVGKKLPHPKKKDAIKRPKI